MVQAGDQPRQQQRGVVGAIADSRLPSVKIAISAISALRRDQRDNASVISGAPSITPMA